MAAYCVNIEYVGVTVMLSGVYDFFGILGVDVVPTTIFELFQWLLCVAVGIGLVVYVLRFIRYMVANISSGGRKL